MRRQTKAAAKRAREAVVKAGHLLWVAGGKVHECSLHDKPCPMCGVQAIVALPEPLAAQQTDGTNAVCHPNLGRVQPRLCRRGGLLVPRFAMFPRLDHLRWRYSGGAGAVVVELIWETPGPWSCDWLKLKGGARGRG